MSRNDPLKPGKKGLQTINEALGTTDEDVKANLSGHFSERQRRQFRMKRSVLVALWFPLLFTIAFLVYVVAVGVVQLSSIEMMLGMLLLSSPVLLGFIAVTVHFRQTHLELVENRVQVVEGVVRQVIDDNFYRRASGYLYVDGHKFAVDLPVLLAFHNARPYRLHFAPRTNMLLAAEPILETDPFNDDEVNVVQTDMNDELPAEHPQQMHR